MLEMDAGVEPASTDLQSEAQPLYQSIIVIRVSQMVFIILKNCYA